MSIHVTRAPTMPLTSYDTKRSSHLKSLNMVAQLTPSTVFISIASGKARFGHSGFLAFGLGFCFQGFFLVGTSTSLWRLYASSPPAWQNPSVQDFSIRYRRTRLVACSRASCLVSEETNAGPGGHELNILLNGLIY